MLSWSGVEPWPENTTHAYHQTGTVLLPDGINQLSMAQNWQLLGSHLSTALKGARTNQPAVPAPFPNQNQSYSCPILLSHHLYHRNVPQDYRLRTSTEARAMEHESGKWQLLTQRCPMQESSLKTNRSSLTASPSCLLPNCTENVALQYTWSWKHISLSHAKERLLTEFSTCSHLGTF